MRTLACAALALLLSTAVFAQPEQPVSLTLRPGDFPEDERAFVAELARVWQQRPSDSSVLYQVAAVFARAGREAEALEALRRMAARGTGVDPRPSSFGKLLEHPEAKRIVEQIRAGNPPVNKATLAFSIPEGDLVSEGIAYSERTKKLYLGSFKRKIIAVDLEGRVSEFVRAAQHGIGVLLGLRVDDERGELWAVSEKVDGKPEDAVVGLFRFRLADGKLIKRYPIETREFSMVNDVAVASDGAAYATASVTGALWRVAAGADQADLFLPPGTLPDPNGVTATPDGRYLFIAGWYGITRVDLRDRSTRLLDQPDTVASGCIDGLYFDRGDLVGVQNCVHSSGRIVRLKLNPALSRIERLEVLESYNPLFEGVTTAAIAGDFLYIDANTQFRKVGQKGAKFDPVRILRLPLR